MCRRCKKKRKEGSRWERELFEENRHECEWKGERQKEELKFNEILEKLQKEEKWEKIENLKKNKLYKMKGKREPEYLRKKSKGK